jgi:5-methyltetrahydropteroyltriglutamate--homocysteine methyltransferase
MQRSTARILTTHTGSLPRPAALVQMVEGHDQREVRAHPGFTSQVHAAVAAVVRQQADVGIDVLTDGEMSKVAFSAYVTERVTGFDGPPRPLAAQIEPRLFPEYYQALPPAGPGFRACNGPITWRGDAYVQQDIATLQAALHGVTPTEVFLPAVSPGQIWFNFPNDYYPTDEAYIYAVADALKHEYRAIVEAGFLLQLDSPELAMAWNRMEFAEKTFADYRQFVAHHVAAINYALEGIPADRVRLHLCWGNGERPHVRDCPIAEFIDIIYTVQAEAISFEGANPRHAHEWKIFKDHPLPAGKLIIPGVIDSLTNVVEHPELVAERIGRYAELVGKENVIAGTDCGFSTGVRAQPRVHPTVAWAKLQALAEGAQLATQQLWGTAAPTRPRTAE